jgi:hypothetical protein
MLVRSFGVRGSGFLAGAADALAPRREAFNHVR